MSRLASTSPKAFRFYRADVGHRYQPQCHIGVAVPYQGGCLARKNQGAIKQGVPPRDLATEPGS